MHSILSDLRIGFRSLRQRPGYFGIAVITLALGIGASTAIFGVVDATLLRPLPFVQPDRLAMVWGVAGPEKDIRGASYIEIADWRRLTHSFQALSLYDETNLNLSGEGPARQLEAESVSPGFFHILGVAPTLGRALEPADDQPGVVGAAVISDALWRSQFGADSGVLNRSIVLDDRPFTIVGVMPPGFKGLSFDTDIWTPLAPFRTEASLESRGGRWLGAIGRLAPGASESAAQRDLDAAAAELEREFPEVNRDRGALLIPLRDSYLTGTRSILVVLLGGAGLLLLIACSNVANLQLVRASDRRGEISVRHALGASRGRVVRQLVTESVAMSLVGGVAGIALAWVAMQTLLPLIPAGALPRYVDVRLDPVVVAFAVAVAVMAGAVVGAIPGLRSNIQPSTALREARSSGPGWRPGRPSLQQVIVGVEVALSVVLLVAAGLAVTSLRKQLAIDPGFRANGVLAARLSLTGDLYDAAARRRFADALAADLRGLPGVRYVAIGSDAPLTGHSSAALLQREGHPDDRIRFYYHAVAPSYFHTLGIPVLRGRGFTASDVADSASVAVVSDALARRIWPGEDAVGKRFRIGSSWATVVGVVGNVHFRDLTTTLMDPSDDPDVYFSYNQLSRSTFNVVLRDGSDPAALSGAVRTAVSRLDPSVPIFEAQPLDQSVGAWTALPRFTSALLAVFGVLSVVLAAIGLYGVMAFIVRGRRREIAIRSAIGARPQQIRRMVLGQGIVVVGIGLAMGGFGSLLVGRALSNLLYGVAPIDPTVLGGSAAALAAAALLASWLPTLQALRVNPQAALSGE